MPFHCPVCENTEYEEIDGLFFCTECNTQSKEYIVQESQVDYEPGGFSNRPLQSAKSQETPSETKKSNAGRPWTIYEGFQYILMAQAEALVNIGADVSLREIIYTIWANYLSKIGVAFCEKEKVIPDVVAETKYGRLRELHRGSFDNPLNHDSPMTARRGGKNRNREPMLMESDEEVQADQIEEGFIDEEEQHYDHKKRDKTAKFAVKSPEWMNMKKTLAMSYVGLMITSPEFLPCDLIRYVYDGQVPYLSATHVLPQDIVFSAQDGQTFNSEIDITDLLPEVNRLIKYLTLYDLPVNNVETLIRRFITELNLPDELNTVCCNLVNKVGYYVWGKRGMYQRQELLAMAYIVTALRMIFGFDGEKEVKKSQHSKEIQELVGPDLKLFVWKEWKNFINYKSHMQFSSFAENKKDISESCLTHLDSVVDWHSCLKRDERKLAYNRIMCSSGMLTRATKEFNETIKKPLEQGQKKISSSLHKGDDTRCIQEKIAVQGKHFRLCTLSHLINIPKFRETVRFVSPADINELDDLYDKMSDRRVELKCFQPVRKDKILMEERPESHLWLLQVCSDIISPCLATSGVCNVLSTLDLQICKIQNLLIKTDKSKT